MNVPTVLKKKFIDIKIILFISIGNNRIILCLNKLAIRMPGTIVFFDVLQHMFLCKLSGSSMFLNILYHPLHIRSEQLYLTL